MKGLCGRFGHGGIEEGQVGQVFGHPPLRTNFYGFIEMAIADIGEGSRFIAIREIPDCKDLLPVYLYQIPRAGLKIADMVHPASQGAGIFNGFTLLILHLFQAAAHNQLGHDRHPVGGGFPGKSHDVPAGFQGNFKRKCGRYAGHLQAAGGLHPDPVPFGQAEISDVVGPPAKGSQVLQRLA